MWVFSLFAGGVHLAALPGFPPHQGESKDEKPDTSRTDAEDENEDDASITSLIVG